MLSIYLPINVAFIELCKEIQYFSLSTLSGNLNLCVTAKSGRTLGIRMTDVFGLEGVSD